jgi:[ribosomal protein S5]-alanine N-acetyltransferase
LSFISAVKFTNMSELVFETQRLVVRRYTKDDLDHLYRLNCDEDVMRYIRPTMSLEEAKDFLQKNLELYSEFPLLGRWATFDRNKNFVGSFAVIHIPGSTDIQLGYALLKQHWGKGYATELTARGVQYAEENGIDPLYAVTEDANVASQKVLLKNSFEYLYSTKEGEKNLFRYQLKRK